MININLKTFSLICVCTVLIVAWATDVVAAKTYDFACEFEIDCDSDVVP